MLKDIRHRLSDPQISRGLHIGLVGWLYVLLFALLYLLTLSLEALGQVFGRLWVPQDRGVWSMPLAALSRPLLLFAFPLLPVLGVIGGILSLVDMFRHKRWALLGLVLSGALPLIVLWMIGTMISGRR